MKTSEGTQRCLRAAKLADVRGSGCKVVYLEGRAIALFEHNGEIYAIDNRCPHMGFPLHDGTVKDGILTCHWHHARFDIASGGTFDLWADDVQSFPVEIREDEVWVDLTLPADSSTYHYQRLKDGLEQRISLVIAKSAIALLDGGADRAEPFRIGLEFGTRYRQAGWGAGLTIHTCMLNLMPYLDAADRPRALYHGLTAVARDCAGTPPRFEVSSLPTTDANPTAFQSWFRQFVEVRDAKGAERCLISAIHAGASQEQIANMLFAAVTDRRYIDQGHPLDFTNKALEALDIAGWEYAEPVLSSLVLGYTTASRMEESNSWRYPIDIVAILERAFEQLPIFLEKGHRLRGSWSEGTLSEGEQLLPVLLGDNPSAIANALLEALGKGCSEVELAKVVAYAASLRIARFHTNNEFGDWDTAHHSFTFANAVQQGLQRVASPELLRGVFDAAMSVYMNRFLNMPAARLPEPDSSGVEAEALLAELPALLDRQQQVKAAGDLVARYLYGGGNPDRLLAMLGKLLLREDRSFHAIQEIEAAFRQYALWRETPAGVHILVAAARYLAAHAPTMRSQGQTYQIAYRLHRGDRLFEE